MKFNIFIFIIISSYLHSNTLSGYDLAKLMDEKKQPLSSKTEISMKLINLKKDRIKQKEMVSVTKDDGNKMLLFFKTPKRDKGVGFLKIEDSNNDKLSLFIPKLKKIRRISSSNQSDSFMGSDLSFEDMLSRDLDDYNYSIISESDTMYVLQSISKDIESEYSKHVSWITKEDLLIKKEESYDKKNMLLKSKSFKQVKMKEYHIISEIDVTNIQKNHRTVLNINTLEVDGNISDDTFKEINLKRSDKFIN